MLKSTYLAVRRALVFIVGVSVVLVGIVMLVTPGPAIIVIPAGLALLATEFVWARQLLIRLKQTVRWDAGKSPAAGGETPGPDETQAQANGPARRRGTPDDR